MHRLVNTQDWLNFYFQSASQHHHHSTLFVRTAHFQQTQSPKKRGMIISLTPHLLLIKLKKIVLLHQDSFYNMFLKHFNILTMDEQIKGMVLEKVLLIYSGRYIDRDCHAYLVSKASYMISGKSLP